MRRTLTPILAATLALGCGGLRMAMVDSAYQRPSNVAVFFTVDGPNGEPIPGLEADDFRIYEDGRIVSEAESQQTIVNPEVAAEHYTLVLVDMSGSVSESEQVPLIESATQQLTAQLQEHQRVAIYAFDGSEEIHRITPFTQSAGAASAGAGRLSGFRPRDPSTNLHGAVVAAIAELDRELERATAPLRFGTVVVFTDGTDRAARVTMQEMGRAIDESPYDFFAIGVGDEIDEGVLGYIGREGYVTVDDQEAIAAAFQRIGERILQMTQRFYLLSYCSPARAGTHTVTVEAVTESGRGAISYEFDATGFAPSCNPGQPPPFDTSQGGVTPRRRGRAGRGARIEVRASAPRAAVRATAGGNPEDGAQ
ncbi:MAG: VWA domain-containing protein [Sandaracinaceae bacterium]|nr:VWA domain-containing protein [Sandaracinaceae bacterium]